MCGINGIISNSLSLDELKQKISTMSKKYCHTALFHTILLVGGRELEVKP